jgi:Mg-chelatase subunit ChlD
MAEVMRFQRPIGGIEMRKSLFALLVGTTVFSCAKSKDMAAGQAAEEPKAEAVEKSPMKMSEGGTGHGVADAATAPMAEPGKTATVMPPPAARPADKGAAMGSASGAGAVATGGDGIGIADRKKSDDVVAYQPQPQGVRAGEWDDNANYRDYLKWIKESPRNVARLDTSDRQFLIVKDKDGKPVPNCKISIETQNGTQSLVTMASGRAMWFPHAYGVTGAVTATTQCGGQDKISTKIQGQLDSITQIVLKTARALPSKRTIDLAFVLDTTGSMSEEIDAVKQTIKAVADTLSTAQTDVRIGLVEYKDRGDSFVTKQYPFSSDLAAFSRSVSGIVASGGGDVPEDMQQGLQVAIEKLQWRTDAVARLVVVIADAPPHLDYQDEKSFSDSAKLAAAKGIKLFTVSASGMDTTGQIVMRQMAQFTGASNMFVLRGGAGPQSVGGGDPKSSCGGVQEQYSSGKLDKLIINKIKQEIAAVDADPTRIAGIGKDESSKPCNERITMAY